MTRASVASWAHTMPGPNAMVFAGTRAVASILPSSRETTVLSSSRRDASTLGRSHALSGVPEPFRMERSSSSSVCASVTYAVPAGRGAASSAIPSAATRASAFQRPQRAASGEGSTSSDEKSWGHRSGVNQNTACPAASSASLTFQDGER